jgi:hypothetical protein
VHEAKSFHPDLTGHTHHSSIDPAVGVTEWLHLQELVNRRPYNLQPVRAIPHTDTPYIHVLPPTPLHPLIPFLRLLHCCPSSSFPIVNIRYLLYLIN